MSRRLATALLSACATLYSVAAPAHPFTWETLMLASARLQPHFDYESHVDAYMRLYRKDLWDRYRNDEFAIQDKREETIERMQHQVASFSLDEPIVLQTRFRFGDYDFKTAAFPLDGLSDMTYFYESNYSSGSLPQRYSVFFDNVDLVGPLAMPKDAARDFLQSRKDRAGNVDRDVHAQLEFRVVRVTDGGRELHADLTRVSLFADAQQANVLATYEK